jgi:hypothetical protein
MDHSPTSSSAIPADETLARSVHCTECNAPPKMPCQKIEWVDMRIPRCTARPFHNRRLRDAKKIEDLRKRKDKDIKSYA